MLKNYHLVQYIRTLLSRAINCIIHYNHCVCIYSNKYALIFYLFAIIAKCSRAGHFSETDWLYLYIYEYRSDLSDAFKMRGGVKIHPPNTRRARTVRIQITISLYFDEKCYVVITVLFNI